MTNNTIPDSMRYLANGALTAVTMLMLVACVSVAPVVDPASRETEIPVVAFSPDASLDGAPLFPGLRQYTGEAPIEKTDIRMATDGKTLKVAIRAYDADPAKLASQESDRNNYPAIWKEDGFEIFFKPESDYPEQYQFVISNTGDWVANHNKHLDGARYKRLPWPGKERTVVEVKRHDKGYDVHLSIPLEIMAFKTPVKPGGRIYGQIVRNYRAHRTPERQTLQLFPAHVYIGKDIPPSNHHPGGFHVYEVVGTD